LSGFVALVGAGPGDPGLLTVKAARLIAEAETLVYDALVAAPIVALASPTCELIYVGKRAGAHTMPQDEITALLVRLGLEGKRVVRLKGGDPFVFGRGSEEAQILRAAGVAYQIVPGISSALAAPAYAGIPVTHRNCNTSFTVATGHEDPKKTASTLDWKRLADGNSMSIFLMAMGNLEYIAAEMQRYGRSPDTPVAIIRDGTTPRQFTITATLATVAEAARRSGIGAPAIVAVGEGVRLRDEIRWFDNHGLFGKRILLTRPSTERDELIERLWEYGAEPVSVPAIAYAAAPNPEALRKAIDDVRQKRYQWLMLSSRHGVETFFRALREADLDARALGSTRIAVVGEKTAAALEAFGVRADLMPQRFNAAELVAALLAHAGSKTDGNILAWAAQGAAPEPLQSLREAGYSVDAVAAYTTVPLASPELAEAAERCEVWTFASISALDAFIAVVPNAAKLRQGKFVACLGPVTASAARERGLAPDTTAEQATASSLLAALAALPITSAPVQAN
jgi:uroporphyrinogen III methyltransferase/synthase